MCYAPFLKDMKTANFKSRSKLFRPVPCGKCYECKKQKTADWSFRLHTEMKRSFNLLFVTLTYNDHNLPHHVKLSDSTYPTTKPYEVTIPYLHPHIVPTLVKKDVQDFLKRLRYYDKGNKKIKYYAVGEYGSRFGRPHYHIILYNCSNGLLINKAWTLGHCYTVPVKHGAIPYVLKYLSKTSLPRLGDPLREFSLMSKGLGSNYLSNNTLAYHNSNVENCFITLEGGQKISIPRYLKNKIYDTTMLGSISAYLNDTAPLRRTKRLSRIMLEEKCNEETAQIIYERRRNIATFRKKIDKIE